MVIFLFMVALCAAIGFCTVYASIQAIKTDLLYRRDNRRYNDDRQQILEEIKNHLNILKHDNNSEHCKTASSALTDLAKYLKDH